MSARSIISSSSSERQDATRPPGACPAEAASDYAWRRRTPEPMRAFTLFLDWFLDA